MRPCTAAVHAPYTMPSDSADALIGRNTRSGLNSVITFSRMRKNFAPSRAKRIFDLPIRGRAATGSKATL